MTAAPEFSRPVAPSRIGPVGTRIVIHANPGECRAVAGRLMIEAVYGLTCAWSLSLGEGGRVLASGTLQADVGQVCVVTLEPFRSAVTEVFDVHFVLAGRESLGEDPDEPDELPYDGVAIDLGEAAVEQLALMLDPYPRKPGAALPVIAPDDPGAGFEQLAKLRRMD